MKVNPTYSADEIKDMCLSMTLDFYSFKIFVELIDSELHLYNQEELNTLMQAGMIVFTRSLLMGSLNFMI